MKFQTFFLLGLVLLFSFGGNAQEYFERAYEPEGGIETFSITDIKQDWKGQLWLANYGEGLSMFNGQDFAHYDENNGLSSLKIRCLAFDENENLWVGSVGGGVSIQHNERFIDFSDSIGKIDENVYSLFRDQDKNMWIGTSNGLFLYKKGEMISLNKTISFPNVPIQSIVEDRFGTIWAGSWQSGLYSIKTTGNNNENILFESITEQNGLLSDNISSLAIDTLGNLVIGTFRGMQRGLLDKGSIQLSLNATRGLPNSQVFDIEYSPNYGMCLAFGDEGVFHSDIESNIWKKLPIQNIGLAYALFNDRENFFWISSWEKALIRVNSSYITPLETNNVSLHGIKNLFAQGDKIYLTYPEKILTLKNDTFNNLTLDQYFESPISQITCVSDTEIIVNYTSGLHQYKNNEWKEFSGFKEFINRPVTAIGHDANHNLWIALEDSPPILFDGETFSVIRTDKFSNKMNFDLIKGAPNGDVWFNSKASGLMRIRGSEVALLKPEDLPRGKILDFDFDLKGNLWFASQGAGVGYIDTNLIVTVVTDDYGLPDDSRSILVDSKQNMWIGTKNGVFAINTGSIDSTQRGYSIHIDENDGLPNNRCIARLITESEDGHIWVSTRSGIAILNPNILRDHKEPVYPRLHIADIKIDFKSINWKELGFKLNRTTFLPENLKLEPDQKQVTFNLNSVSFKNPQSTFYKYRLKGLEEGFSPLSSAPFITFHDLHAGNYTLIISPCNIQGDCSEEAVKFSFTIKKPFYNTWWFYLTVFVLIIGVFLLIIRLRDQSLRTAQKLLEKRVEFRTKEIRTQNRIIEENNRDITDSIKYAKRIQRAFMPSDEDVGKIFKENFIMYLPRNMVSGDFYMVNKFGHKKLLIVADCTGHGVPGAMMSMLGYGLFIEAIQSKVKGSAAQIFNYTSTNIIHLLKQHGDEGGSQDGMDASLLSYHPKTEEFEFVGANNSGFLIGDVTFENNEKVIEHKIGDIIIYELKPDKQPLGINKSGTTYPFISIKGTAKPGTRIYLLSDGYADQFGSNYGVNPTNGGKKFRIKRLREKLAEVQHLPMNKQHQELHTTLSIWKGTQEQVDDITLIGVKL